MQIPKLVVNIWPSSSGKIFEAVIKLTVGEAISIFPVKLNGGKGGLHLVFPKNNSVAARYRSPIIFINEKAKKMIAQSVEKSFRSDKSICKEYFSKQPLNIEYYVYPEKKFDQVGTAVLEINHIFRICDIRLIENSSGRRMVLLPERFSKEDGELVINPIIELRGEWEELIKRKIWEAYDNEIVKRSRKEAAWLNCE